MLKKLIRVLGIKEGGSSVDPDESYVLTVDNLMKMLAIHMKFR